MTDERYPSPAAVESAIRSAAGNAFASDHALSIHDRIRQEHFRRFLSRIFSAGERSGWLLKGGTGILARMGAARATNDVDLVRESQSLDAALEDLKYLAAHDLGDFFRFEYAGHRDAVGGGQQARVEGYRVAFDIYVGANRRGQLHVDLVVNSVVTDEATVIEPANALDLPKLKSHGYRLYPVVDQIADKVCATLAEYNGKPSSRERDLVDLVALAATTDVDGRRLHQALVAESQARSIDLPESFVVPSGWGRRYARDAKAVPACAEYRTVDLASALMHTFLDPVLRGEVFGVTWGHVERDWRG